MYGALSLFWLDCCCQSYRENEKISLGQYIPTYKFPPRGLTSIELFASRVPLNVPLERSQPLNAKLRVKSVWICYPGNFWVLYKAWAMSNRCISPHRPRYDFQLYPRHDQLLPWILEPRAWTVDLTSGVVVQWWWLIYGYVMQLFHECYMRHGPHLTGVNHPTYHGMTSSYSPDILNCYPGYWK